MVGVEVERKFARRDERADLPEDRAAGARIKLGMVRHVQRLFCAVSQEAAQLHMATALRRDRESEPLKDPDDIGSRQSPKVAGSGRNRLGTCASGVANTSCRLIG